MRIVGIETSCDETAIGIVEDGRTVLANAVSSSLAQHGPYGGVIPEIAARAHVETIWDVFATALEEAHLSPDPAQRAPDLSGGAGCRPPWGVEFGATGLPGGLRAIDAVAVTQGPGLLGALHIGLAFAKGLALSLDRPLIPVDHLAAHLYAAEMTDPTLELPYVGLVVSGGHTLLCVAHADCRFELLGETKDDAVGEAFDKVAKLLGLGYPGGPVIDRLSDEGNAAAVRFPRGHTKQPFNFSFSGLKTAVYHYVEKIVGSTAVGSTAVRNTADTLSPPVEPSSRRAVEPRRALSQQEIADIAASFQEAAIDILVTKTLKACQRTGITRVAVGGGVASNRRLRARLSEEGTQNKLQVVFPPPPLCVDNGAMVAGLGYPLLQLGRVAPLSITSDSNLCLV